MPFRFLNAINTAFKQLIDSLGPQYRTTLKRKQKDKNEDDVIRQLKNSLGGGGNKLVSMGVSSIFLHYRIRTAFDQIIRLQYGLNITTSDFQSRFEFAMRTMRHQIKHLFMAQHSHSKYKTKMKIKCLV